MSPLPEEMVDRWQNRREDGPGEGTVYWHILLGNNPDLRATVKNAQDKLSDFPGLHMTPLQWLHITILVAGPENGIPRKHMLEMLRRADSLLSGTHPMDVTLSRVLYHPEAIVLAVHPSDALAPIRQAALTATRTVIGSEAGHSSRWVPHTTLGYSTAHQSAKPITDMLGLKLPVTEVKVDSLSLVVQRGPERLWDWHTIGTVRLSEGSRKALACSPTWVAALSAASGHEENVGRAD